MPKTLYTNFYQNWSTFAEVMHECIWCVFTPLVYFHVLFLFQTLPFRHTLEGPDDMVRHFDTKSIVALLGLVVTSGRGTASSLTSPAT